MKIINEKIDKLLLNFKKICKNEKIDKILLNLKKRNKNKIEFKTICILDLKYDNNYNSMFIMDWNDLQNEIKFITKYDYYSILLLYKYNYSTKNIISYDKSLGFYNKFFRDNNKNVNDFFIGLNFDFDIEKNLNFLLQVIDLF